MINSIHFPILFKCDCSSDEHQIIVEVDTVENMLFCHIHLQKRPFLKRIWMGLKYIFGYHCRYGHWEEFIWKQEDAPLIKALADMLVFQQELNRLVKNTQTALDNCKVIIK